MSIKLIFMLKKGNGKNLVGTGSGFFRGLDPVSVFPDGQFLIMFFFLEVKHVYIL